MPFAHALELEDLRLPQIDRLEQAMNGVADVERAEPVVASDRLQRPHADQPLHVVAIGAALEWLANCAKPAIGCGVGSANDQAHSWNGRRSCS